MLAWSSEEVLDRSGLYRETLSQPFPPKSGILVENAHYLGEKTIKRKTRRLENKIKGELQAAET